MSPLHLFEQWHAEELAQSQSEVPSAGCLSTIGLDGYPNARFVDLKKVDTEGFVITGPLHSRKALEIAECTKVALCFWWVGSQRQVRIQGDAFPVSPEDADQYFSERGRAARIVSIISEQGAAIEDLQTLQEEFKNMELAFKDNDIPRPDDWGGFLVKPIRVEFMQFRPSRFHERILFSKLKDGWKKEWLQP